MIARSVGVSRTTVGEYLRRTAVIGITWPLPAGMDDAGDCQEFCVEVVVESQSATKRSPNITANWVLAAFHSRAAIFQSLLTSRKTRNSSFDAASSFGK